MAPVKMSSCVSLDADLFSKLSNDGKIIVNMLSEHFSKEVTTIKKSFEDGLAERDRVNKKLSEDYAKLKKDLVKMSDRVEELETRERKFDLIISGKSLPAVLPNENSKSIALSLVESSLNYKVNPQDVVKATRVGSHLNKKNPDRRSLLLTFSSPDLVQDVISSAKTIKPPNLFFNENLTVIKHKICKTLRSFKHRFQDKISGCGSKFGRVSAWVKPPRPDTRGARDIRVSVNSVDQLEDFCTRY